MYPSDDTAFRDYSPALLILVLMPLLVLTVALGLTGHLKPGAWVPTEARLVVDSEKLSNDVHTWLDEMNTSSSLKTPLLKARYYLRDAMIEAADAHNARSAELDLMQGRQWLREADRDTQMYWTDPVYKKQIPEMSAHVADAMGATPADEVKQLKPVMNELSMVLNSL